MEGPLVARLLKTPSGVKPKRQLERGPFDLIEEAFHLLRTCPASILASYYFGTIPFVLGLLYFFSDMSQSAFARDRLGTASGVMVVLFFWAKTWQSIFARELLAHRAGALRERLGLARFSHLFCIQGAIHATGLFLWPIALGLLLPFGWVNAFYQNATAIGTSKDGKLTTTMKQAARQSHLWVAPNHTFLLVWKAFLIFAFINWVIAALLLPFLAKMLLGIESPFTKSPISMLNTTLFAVVTALVYLSTDPWHKAVYVLRCFYGQSLRTGYDLRGELKELVPPNYAQTAAAMVLLGTVLMMGAAAEAASAPEVVSSQHSVAPEQLDKSINEVLQQREYSWRLPRSGKEREVGLIEGFIASIGDTIAAWIKAIAYWTGKVMDEFFKIFRPRMSLGTPGIGWALAVRTFAFVLLVLLVFFAAVFLFRLWQRQRTPDEVVAAAIGSAPDLSSHDVAADQLPEDEWIKLGRELLHRGELRLAMRAFYLATLAHLAQRNLITLARHKSNYDYNRELGRRAHALPAVTEIFGENVAAFDRAWYGLHPVDEVSLDRFASNLERIKCA
jgi:hypothetical protein